MTHVKKLLIVTDAWSPQINGVVTTFTEVIPRLRSLGVETSVVHPGMFKTFPMPAIRKSVLRAIPGW